MELHAGTAQVVVRSQWERTGNIHTNPQIGENAPSSFNQLYGCTLRTGVAFASDRVEMALVLSALTHCHGNAHGGMAGGGLFFI
jgi:hypothetical protein